MSTEAQDRIKSLQKTLSDQIKQEEQAATVPSDISPLSGFVQSGLQGLTFGTSDEIGAFLGSLTSVFTDESFSESFDRRLEDARDELQSFKESNPKLSLAGEITGSLAPIAVSLLLTPFTGGASASAAAVAASRILSNPLLAGKIIKPGSGLLKTSVEAAKLGGIQGTAYGVGTAEGSIQERILPGVISGGVGLTGGALLPPLIAAGGRIVSGVKDFVTKSNFNADEIKAIRTLADKFGKDEISTEEVIKKIQENVEADKLVGQTPVEILADYGGPSTIRKLRGIKIRAPELNIDDTLIRRTTGLIEEKAEALLKGESPNIQSTRLLESLEQATEKTIKTPEINLQAGVEDISNASQKILDPLYKQAYIKNQNVMNLEVYDFLRKPVIKDAYNQAIDLFQERQTAKGEPLTHIPPLKKLLIIKDGKVVGTKKKLPLEFLDLVKRVADRKAFKEYQDRTIDKSMMGTRKKITNNFRNILKNSIDGDEYALATKSAADIFDLEDAYKLGVDSYKTNIPSPKFFKNFENLKTQYEKDAFKIGVFEQIYNQINKVGDNLDLVRKIFNTPDTREKLSILFGNDIEAKEAFILKLVREANIAKNTGAVTGGSNTAEKVIDSQDAVQALSDIVVAGTAPTSSAGIRAEANLFETARDLISNPSEKRARNLGKILLEQNPDKQQEILELMNALNKDIERKKFIIDAASRSGIRLGTGQLGISESLQQ